MHGYIPRSLEDSIKKDLDFFPVVAVLGPRQSGKSTLAKHIIQKEEGSVYLDLEDYNDLDRLHDPLFYFTRHAGSLVCLDEIQLRPNIFPAIKSFVDKDNKNIRFMVLPGNFSVLSRYYRLFKRQNRIFIEHLMEHSWI